MSNGWFLNPKGLLNGILSQFGTPWRVQVYILSLKINDWKMHVLFKIALKFQSFQGGYMGLIVSWASSPEKFSLIMVKQDFEQSNTKNLP